MRMAAAIASIGIVWDSLELMTARDELLGRFFEWRVVRSRYYILIRRPVLSALFDVMLSGRVFTNLVSIHAVAAVAFVIVLPLSHALAALFASVVLLGHLCIHLRLLVGMDGADQMQTVLWVSFLVYSLDLGTLVATAAAGFLCAELLLSYLVSGSAKLASPAWRIGTAILRITRTGTYSTPRVSGVLHHYFVSCCMGWSVMAFEVLGPALLFAGRPGTLAFIAVGIVFHLGIAFTMGLTTFVFAFLAAYPVLYATVAR